MEPAPPSPVTASERIQALDVVRGLAVLGILVMNVVEFALPMSAYDNPAYAGGAEGLDRVVWLIQSTLFDGKMRALFSMLFGAGIVLFTDRVASHGAPERATDLLLRRCLWLVLFGMVHRFVLQWTGDILYIYGLLGLIAAGFRTMSARGLLVVGVLILTAFVPIGLRKHALAVEQRDQAATAIRLEADGEPVPDELRAARTRWERRAGANQPSAETLAEEIDAIRGGWTSVARYRWDHNHAFQSTFLYYYFVFDVLGMMLVGMGLMKAGFFAGGWSTRAHAVAIAVAGVAALGSYVWASAWAATGFSPIALELRALHDTTYAYSRGLVGLGWAAALILLVRAGRGRFVTVPLAAVGRMAFSNYILQTVCCTLLFFGYGLGWYGELSRSTLMLVVAAVSALQVVWSLAWLRTFRFGPLEWTWRALTYWSWPPLRRAP